MSVMLPVFMRDGDGFRRVGLVRTSAVPDEWITSVRLRPSPYKTSLETDVCHASWLEQRDFKVIHVGRPEDPVLRPGLLVESVEEIDGWGHFRRTA